MEEPFYAAILGVFPDANAARNYSSEVDVQSLQRITGWNITDRFRGNLNEEVNCQRASDNWFGCNSVLMGFVAVIGVHRDGKAPNRISIMRSLLFSDRLEFVYREELGYSPELVRQKQELLSITEPRWSVRLCRRYSPG